MQISEGKLVSTEDVGGAGDSRQLQKLAQGDEDNGPPHAKGNTERPLRKQINHRSTHDASIEN